MRQRLRRPHLRPLREAQAQGVGRVPRPAHPVGARPVPGGSLDATKSRAARSRRVVSSWRAGCDHDRLVDGERRRPHRSRARSGRRRPGRARGGGSPCPRRSGRRRPAGARRARGAPASSSQALHGIGARRLVAGIERDSQRGSRASKQMPIAAPTVVSQWNRGSISSRRATARPYRRPEVEPAGATRTGGIAACPSRGTRMPDRHEASPPRAVYGGRSAARRARAQAMRRRRSP